MTELKNARFAQAQEKRTLGLLSKRTMDLPSSVTEVKQLMEEKFVYLAKNSAEFGTLLSQLVPQFHVYLVRLCDGGHLMPRAKLTFDLSQIVPDARHVLGLRALLMGELTLDLFERPPQRERIRVEAVILEKEGLQQRVIGASLSEKAKQATVQHALALDRKMREMKFPTPYVIVEEPPADYPKLRRHTNSRYNFQPLEGYQRPPI